MAESRTLKKPSKATFEALRKKPAATQRITVPMVEDASSRLKEAQDRVQRTDVLLKNHRRRPPKDDGPIAESDRWSNRLTELEEEQREAEVSLTEAKDYFDENSVEMVFRAMGRKAYEEISLAHPAREEDHKDARDQTGDDKAKAQWNSETYPMALVAASCIEPEMTGEEVQELFDTWNQTEIMTLFNAAVSVNTVRQVGELGKERG